MRGVADTQQAGTVPLPQTIDLHRQQLDLLPILQFLHAIAEERSDLQNGFSKCLKPTRLYFRKRVLLDDESGLEIIAAVDEDEDSAKIDVSQELVRIAVVARNTEPENVDGNAILVNFESGGLSG